MLVREKGFVTVVGGGLAGTEAALQLADRGFVVRLVEMRPHLRGPAHSTDGLAELVCSNSFKGTSPDTATGALKEELRALGSHVMRVADQTRIPAGAALAVDRQRFSEELTGLVQSHTSIELVRAEATAIPAEGPVIIATGPLTSAAFERVLSDRIGSERLAFFDAAAPIVEAASIDHDRVFAASRYGKGGGSDYLNCPMDREPYERFVTALTSATQVVRKEFESSELFQACQPVEEIARRGPDALRFGALKPVGLTDPRDGARPWAVVQLRPENRAATAYNMVGFQTNLTFAEQRRVFSLIPGLENAEFLRYGVMHRNTFVDSPRLLTPALALRTEPRIRLAGQLTGTEGYLEAVAGGLLAALDIAAEHDGLPTVALPATTALGALIGYATDESTAPYQPMHVNWGLVPPLDPPVRGKRLRYEMYGTRARADLWAWRDSHPLFATAGDPEGRTHA